MCTSEITKTLKRKRSLPITPPLSADDPQSTKTLDRAVHVLATEATALSHVTRLYQTEPAARDGLLRAVDTIVNVNEWGGKLVVCGIGKSGLVGKKLVATMKSLGMGSSFLHAAEAIHGDLGDIRKNDALLLISYSARTSEIMTMLPHVPSTTPIIILTSHTSPTTCHIMEDRPDAILLPGPIHESEETSFGVSAPTTSTTVAMAIGDMLAITAADKIYQEESPGIFKKNHPGGAIGADQRKSKKIASKDIRTDQV